MRNNRLSFRTPAALAAILAAGMAIGTAQAQSIGPVFVIAMENHNWTQPSSYTSLQPIFGNPAAPYINSLVTAGNTNAKYVSYASNYRNVQYNGVDVHPSEPNYIAQEAGSSFGNTTDNDPSAASHNIYTAPHLTSLFNAAGVTWKNYQEDSQYATSAIHSASGTGGTAPSGLAVGNNPYYGTAQYNYAVKHNPMAFFSDTATQNVAPISQITSDLSSHNVAQYNWITPNQYNDMHSGLSGGFTYNGTHFTGDQAAVATGDNFLATLVPQIMVSDAFQNHNGTIIIWNDELEGGNLASGFTGMEIVISKLAKGNAYVSTIPYNHFSDLKTMQELYSVGDSTSATGFLNGAAGVSDLSDLFQAGALPNAGASSIPGPAALSTIALAAAGFGARRRRA